MNANDIVDLPIATWQRLRIAERNDTHHRSDSFRPHRGACMSDRLAIANGGLHREHLILSCQLEKMIAQV